MQEFERDLPEGLQSGVTGLDEALRPRRSRRTTVLRFGVAALALVVTIGILAHPFVNFPWPRIGQHTTTATSVAPGQSAVTGAQEGTPLVILQTNVNFGITINGQPVTFDNPQLLLHVNKGKNTLAFAAPPFIPFSCSFEWPITPSSGTDPQASCASFGSESGSGLPGDVSDVNFYLTLANIPPPLQSSLTQTLGQLLVQGAATLKLNVPAGDYVLSAFGSQGVPLSHITHVPLRAHLFATLASPDPAFACQTAICAGSFIDPTFGNDHAIEIINFALTLRFGWQFTTVDGQAAGTIMDTPENLENISLDVNMHLDPQQGWQLPTTTQDTLNQEITQQILSNYCNERTGIIQTFAGEMNIQSTSTNEFSSLQGCRITMEIGSSATDTFIDRFGALLAVDKGAHQLAPSLPIAPTDEVQAIGQG